MNLIAKLLMNSLYGRFGMDEEMLEYSILPLDSIDKSDNNEFTDIVDFDNGFALCSYPKPLAYKTDPSGIEGDLLPRVNISIPIASSVTAYPRTG